jgi:hypothetical protein
MRGPGKSEEQIRGWGLGPWIRRNPSLLMRLFIVVVFSFAASTVASNFSHGLEGAPTVLSVEPFNSGRLPASAELGDYVRVRGTANVGENLDGVGLGDSGIAISTRYSASYFYFRPEETRGNLLIQTRGSGSKRVIGNGLGISQPCPLLGARWGRSSTLGGGRDRVVRNPRSLPPRAAP